MKNILLGIDIGGTKVAYGISLEDLKLIARDEFPYDNSLPSSEIYSKLFSSLNSLLEANGFTPDDVISIGIGVPGVINKDGKSLKFAANAKILNDFPLCESLEKDFTNARILMENDANTATLAESVLGAGKEFDNMIYATISTGVGGGIIINRQLFRGSHMAAGEIGHMIIYPGGEPCGCGNFGCAEAYAGGANYPNIIKKKLASGYKSVLSDYEKINGQALVDAMSKNDKLAIETFEELCKTLAILFFNIYRFLNIDCYVLGGGFTNIGDILFSTIEKYFTELRNGPDTHEPVYFKKAFFPSSTIGIMGSLIVAKNNM